MHDGFADQEESFYIPSQRYCYSFKANIFLNKESIIAGNTTELVIKPKIVKNQFTEISTSRLTNCTVKIEGYNYVDKVPVSKIMDNLQITDELVIPFWVPPHMSQLEVKFSCEFDKEKFSHSERFEIETHANP